MFFIFSKCCKKKEKESTKPKIKHLRTLTEAAAGLQVNYFYAKEKCSAYQ